MCHFLHDANRVVMRSTMSHQQQFAYLEAIAHPATVPAKTKGNRPASTHQPSGAPHPRVKIRAGIHRSGFQSSIGIALRYLAWAIGRVKNQNIRLHSLLAQHLKKLHCVHMVLGFGGWVEVVGMRRPPLVTRKRINAHAAQILPHQVTYGGTEKVSALGIAQTRRIVGLRSNNALKRTSLLRGSAA